MRETIKEGRSIPSGTALVARRAMKVLQERELPFLVAGAYALALFTGIRRHTKDFDIFVSQTDVERCLSALGEAGFETELTSGVWIAKARLNGEFVDLIFNSGNAVSPVDESWFERAEGVELLGLDVLLCPVEEMIWTKSFVMERERFDGADVAHLLRARAQDIDWEHILALFGEHWRVLLSHLILFEYIYPSKKDLIPPPVMRKLLGRAVEEQDQPPPKTKICRGTMLSRTQYLVDVDRWGCLDARVEPHGSLTEEEASELSPRDG